MTPPPQRIKQVISAEFGSGICDCVKLNGGRAAETYRITLADGETQIVCKIGGPSVRTGDVVEPLVLELVEQTTSLPAPSVLSSGRLTGGEQRPWALYEFCEGEQPTPYRRLDLEVQAQIIRDIGSILGELHTARSFERTGGLARDGETLVIADPVGANFPDRGRHLLQRLDSDYDWQPVLAHGDLYPGNLLVDEDGSITGLVDWGNAHVTTAGYALARAKMRFIDWFRFRPVHRNRLTDALAEGYREHSELPSDYPILSAYYETLWLAQSADRIRRHIQTSSGRQRLRKHVSSLLSRALTSVHR